MEYGPFTPQECEKAIAWLKEHHIKFEVIKDQATENEFKVSSGANIVKQAEFRTETFLAQLFYLEIPEIDAEVAGQLNSMFGVKTETFPQSLTEKPDNIDLTSDILKSSQIKRLWAILLIAIWAILFVGYFFAKHEH